MTERKIYQPTKNQERNWDRFKTVEMPSDDEFKARWKKAHHGKETGWGMGKRNWVLSNMTNTREYQQGIWQGRADKAAGLEYSEERNDSAYNLGYFRGYVDFESDLNGWDKQTKERFFNTYGKQEA